MKEEILQKKENVEDKNDNNKNSIIGILIVIIIALIGVVVYFAFIKDNNKPVDDKKDNGEQTNSGTKTNDTEYKPWMEYILEQDITKIELAKVPCMDDKFDSKTIEINVNQLKDIFKKFMNYKLEVNYTGGGGWDCGETLTITYKKDGKEYKLEYLGNEGHVVPSGDGCATIYDKDLEKVLYNSSDVKNEENKDQEDICVMYSLITPDSYLFDEYFK